jgi:hypothetical protein
MSATAAAPPGTTCMYSPRHHEGSIHAILANLVNLTIGTVIYTVDMVFSVNSGKLHKLRKLPQTGK